MGRHITDYGIGDAYKYYKEEHGDPHGVSSSVFSQICKEFYTAISEAIIYQAFDYKLPYRLGRIRVRKYKPKLRLREDGSLDRSKLRPDWAAVKALWKEDAEAKKNKQLVYHLNEHSDGYQHRWFWEKRTSNIPNHSAYCFIPSRNNKRTLAAAIKNENIEVDYFE